MPATSELRRLAALLAVLFGVGFSLAGCFTSTEPFVTSANAVQPFTTLVFQGRNDTDRATLVSDGAGGYRDRGNDSSPDRYQLALIRPDTYLLQVQFGPGPEDGFAYAVAVADRTAGEIGLYKVMAADSDFDEAAGRPRCDGDAVCLNTAQPLIDLALAAIDAGEAPQIAYSIISLD